MAKSKKADIDNPYENPERDLYATPKVLTAEELLNSFLEDNHIRIYFNPLRVRQIEGGGFIIDPPTSFEAEYRK